MKGVNELIISVVNNKGGVSKTTISLMLGKEIMSKGKSVLFIDLDEQMNLTYALIGKKEKGFHKVTEDSHINAMSVTVSPHFAKYDYVVIDTPPAINDEVKWAIKMADKVIIPMLMESFSIIGLGEILKLVDKEKVLVVPTMVQKGTKLHREILEEAKEYLNEEGIQMGKVIPRTIKIPDAIEAGKFYNLNLWKEITS